MITNYEHSPEITVIDFDNAQKTWFITDLGTVVWTGNMQYFMHRVPKEQYETEFAQFKEWILEAYVWPTSEDELQQGCNWRRNFMHELIVQYLPYVPKTDPSYWALKTYLEMDNVGLIPTC